MELELVACRREAKEHAEKSTVREVKPPGPVSSQVLPSYDSTEASLNSTEREHRKKVQIVAQVVNQPTPRNYRDNNKVECEPDRHQGLDQLT